MMLMDHTVGGDDTGGGGTQGLPEEEETAAVVRKGAKLGEEIDGDGRRRSAGESSVGAAGRALDGAGGRCRPATCTLRRTRRSYVALGGEFITML